MAREQHKPEPDDPRKPDSPADLTKPTLVYTLKKTLREFSSDQCTDLAASLTYYTVLALFPGLLAVVSILGLVSDPKKTIDTLLDLVNNIGASRSSACSGTPSRDSCARQRRRSRSSSVWSVRSGRPPGTSARSAAR